MSRFLFIKYNSNVAQIAHSVYSPFVFLMAVSLFLMVKEIFKKVNLSNKSSNIIRKFAKLSFGVYLIHPMYIVLINKLNISTLSSNTFITVPLFIVIIYLVSMITSYILSKIPILGKYIV